MERNIYCCYTPVKLHRRLCHYPLFFPIFLQFFFFNIHFFFLIFTLTITFLHLLHFHLPTILYFNVTVHLSLCLPLFCIFLFTLFYYKFVILSSILYIVFPHKKVLSLSLSLSLSQFFGGFFYFSYISALG